MSEALEETQDRKTVDAFVAGGGRSKNAGIPSRFMKRVLAGENPVRVYRQARDMSATALSGATGLPQSYISNIETGKKPGSSAAMQKIAAAKLPGFLPVS